MRPARAAQSASSRTLGDEGFAAGEMLDRLPRVVLDSMFDGRGPSYVSRARQQGRQARRVKEFAAEVNPHLDQPYSNVDLSRFQVVSEDLAVDQRMDARASLIEADSRRKTLFQQLRFRNSQSSSFGGRRRA